MCKCVKQQKRKAKKQQQQQQNRDEDVEGRRGEEGGDEEEDCSEITYTYTFGEKFYFYSQGSYIRQAMLNTYSDTPSTYTDLS